MDYRDTDLAAVAASVRSGERSASSLAESTLARIAAYGAQLNAFVAQYADEEIMAQAARIDGCVARGEDPGALAGVMVGVKDLEDVHGLPTRFGSALWEDAAPATRDSLMVTRMREAGAIIVGKTSTPEFGCKGVTDSPAFGFTANPWNLDYSPGGSSGGSAAALAAGLVPLATGSDGGGSIRIPAAMSGLSGFKASQGRVPLADPGAPTTGVLAVRGPMARSMRDTVLALDVVRGDAAGDIYGLPDAPGSWLAAFDAYAVARRLPARVVWSPTLGFAQIDDDVRAVCEVAVDRLREAGIEVVEREHVLHSHPLVHWWNLWTAAMARKLGDRVGTEDWERIDPALRGMIEFGLGVTGADYARAMDACHDYNVQLEACFAEAGATLILTPTVAGRAPRAGEPGVINGIATAAWVEMTFALNMTRSPVATVHAGTDPDGLPVGLQVIGRQRADVEVLCAAGCFEELLGGPGRAPYP